ncbi:MAG TPA: hypothetical protein ENH43_00965 [Phycisphaerales bacterium]|nr:hypothetical protein [Phycisphaerales bacterium]
MNEEKQVDREFGFEKLLHEIGDEWEIEKPYMNIFRRNFKCYITADRGRVQVETAVGRPSPKDATLTGNVVIHILPENGSNIKESFIYLDDIVFISEKSQFSTAGPVKFVSEDAQLLGTGLELVYNDQAGRIEFLRIIQLESLRIKTSSKASLFSRTTQGGKLPVTEPQLSSGRTDTPSNKLRAPNPEDVTPAKAGARTTNSYRCVFSKNVVIDTPDRLIFADQVTISNIRSGKGTKPALSKAEGVEGAQSGKDYEPRVTDNEPQTAGKEQQLDDIVVTCDSGIVVTPMDVARESWIVNRESAVRRAAQDNEPQITAQHSSRRNDEPRTTFAAQRIDYNTITGDVVADGPSELTFYINDVMGAEEIAVPVKITAREKVEFLPAVNQVTFEGDTLCTMLRDDPNSQQKYTLSAQKLTVNFSDSATDIESLAASGGVVRLVTVKTAGEELLGGIELKCRKFDYDTGQQMFLATGPGIIKVDNSRISEPNIEAGKFSLQGPCWAFMQDFKSLRYFLEANRVIADAGRQGTLRIDYIPVVEGRDGQHVTATARKIVANLTEIAGGQTGLSTLTATDRITYEEEDIQFAGGKLFYDADKSIMTVQGDKSQSCMLNGALVDGIEYDLKTGKVNAEISGPGLLLPKR